MSEFENVEAYLPDVVKEMVQIIGFPATEKLIKSLGGVYFRFSDGLKYFPKLVEVVGMDAAKALRQHFHRSDMYIPRCEVALKVLRNQHFKREFDRLCDEKGLSGRMAMLELCPQFQLSDRQGWEIIRCSRRPTIAQPILF